MYVSKAMQNIRGNAIGPNLATAVNAPYRPAAVSVPSLAPYQAAGNPIFQEVAASILFSAGDIVTDDVWNNLMSAPFGLTSLRSAISAAIPGCVMDAAYHASGRLRIVTSGEGERTFDFSDGSLNRLGYTKAFNRMYIVIANTSPVSESNCETVLELTPKDLQQMNVPMTDNGNGTFTLTGQVVLGNIAFR